MCFLKLLDVSVICSSFDVHSSICRHAFSASFEGIIYIYLLSFKKMVSQP